MWYVLKNKDKEVVRFSVRRSETIVGDLTIKSVFIENMQVLAPNLVPKSLKLDNKAQENLEYWIEHRKIPKNRVFVEEIVHSLNLDDKDFLSYVDVTLALSLNDTYWIVPADKNYLWKDYNLYENSFNETLALVAFTGHSAKIKGLITSPELTTNGMLKKCWHRNERGIIELYKGNSEEHANRGKEAYCEYYMAQIAKVLDFNHVSYDLRRFHGEMVSTCEIFTSQEYGYISICDCIEDTSLFLKKNTAKLIAKIKEIYGVQAFEDLLLFDTLIGNTDRHLGNFGMLIDNNTNELVKPAPIFDNGMAFFNHITKRNLKDINSFVAQQESALGFSFLEQLQLIETPRHIPKLINLHNFTFTRHEKYNLSEEWLQAGERFIQQRSQEIIQIIAKKQTKSQETPLHSQILPTQPTQQHKELPIPSKGRSR